MKTCTFYSPIVEYRIDCACAVQILMGATEGAIFPNTSGVKNCGLDRVYTVCHSYAHTLCLRQHPN